jgi:hypothetical protein
MSTTAAIQPHNERPAAVWSSGGALYDQISRGIADSIEHCVLRLDPQPGGEAAWNTFSRSYGPTKALADSLDEARRAKLQHDFIAFHDGFPTEIGICVPREYLLSIGARR